MKNIPLNGTWSMTYGSKEERGILFNKELEKKLLGKKYEAHVPTTMYEVLVEQKAIEDPFYRENEQKYTQLSDIGCTFQKIFTLSPEDLSYEVFDLHFEGLDTLATIFLNGVTIAKTDNMHRDYHFLVKDHVVIGENILTVHFTSPVQVMREIYKRRPQWGTENCLQGYDYLRKAHYQFGWDWGPKLPDMGIWRPVTLTCYSWAQLKDVSIRQHHLKDGSAVILPITVTIERQRQEEITCSVRVKDKDNQIVAETSLSVIKTKAETAMTITNPQLWWPNNLGGQPLYTVEVTLLYQGQKLDEKKSTIGLRTITLDQSPKGKGRNFAFRCNGVEFFAMGANYIPQDAIIARGEKKQKISRLLLDCKRANYNCIRVWGGGSYPLDHFYDECDRLGLIVWQDMMFACGVYHMSEKFTQSIREEIRYTIKRVRNHASLALICGNNEMEGAFVHAKDWGIPRNAHMDKEYLFLFEELIPNIIEELAPDTQYWPSSPSSGGGFRDPENDDYGDVHYWKVFHGNEHYKHFRDHYFRFISEFGMESLPDMKTIQAFSAPADRHLMSTVMEDHNKVIKPYNGNVKVLSNIALEFDIPRSFVDFVYISQVFQAEAIKVATSHFRSNRGTCMGSIYWQLNDDYPVISWSSIDYYGRWKALHYAAKRFYAPVLLSAQEKGLECTLSLSNEQPSTFRGKVQAEIRERKSTIIRRVEKEVTIAPFTAQTVLSLSISDLVAKNGVEYNELTPFSQYDGSERNYFVSYRLIHERGSIISSDTQLFTSHKFFPFQKAHITIQKGQNEQECIITSDVYTKSLMLSTRKTDVVFSDNCFDLLPGEEKVIQVIEGTLDFEELTYQCVNNVVPIS